MVARKSLLALGLLTLVVAVSISGYANVGNTALAQHTSTPSESTIEQRALGNNTTINSVTGTVTIEMEQPNSTQTMTADVWQRPPNHVRYEYTDGPMAGDVMVSNGSSVWMYNETTNTARHLSLTGENAGMMQNLTKAFQQLSNEFTVVSSGRCGGRDADTYSDQNTIEVAADDMPLYQDRHKTDDTGTQRFQIGGFE
ncbi:LolA family protein [Haladaptatus sp. DFWS20]|uniref:LolA family protein n=1 Tax=Haladaptatus sp. DFWS20 TaxID=3403467 RepID=UPI003EBED0B9